MSLVVRGKGHVEEVKMSGVLSDEQVVVEHTYSDIDSLRHDIHNKMIGLIKLYPGSDLQKLASVPAIVDRLYVKAHVATESELLALVQAWRVRTLYCKTEIFRGCLESEDVEIRRWSGDDMLYDEVESRDMQIVSFKPGAMQTLVAEPIVANWEAASPLLEQLDTVRRFTLSQVIVNFEDARRIQGIFSYGLDRVKLDGCHTEQGVVQNWVGCFARSAVQTMTIASPPTEMVWELDDLIHARMNPLQLASAPTSDRWVFTNHSI